MDGSILIVDDDEDSALLMRDWLRRRGFRADAVNSGDRALDHLHHCPVDVVVTDLHMPGMSGIELCIELGKRNADLLSIVVTGNGGSEDAAEAMTAGAYAFFTKPVKVDALASTIGGALYRLSRQRAGETSSSR